MGNILEIKNLCREVKGFKLDNVSFSLEAGAIMGFIGENGAGKTTTINLILNSIARNSGEILVFEKDNIKDEIYVKSNIGYVPDEDYFMPASTLQKHAKVFKLFYESWSDELFDKYTSMWNLPKNKKISEFSKGMKTKAMLAMALSHNPSLLILDEPTSGLDPVARIEMLDILRDFVEEGEKSVLLSTHITSDLDKIADYITLIHKGTILESISMDMLEEKYTLLSGGIEELSNDEDKFIGLKKGKVTFEGLITRENAERYYPDIKGAKPDIESFLTYHIWGDKK